MHSGRMIGVAGAALALLGGACARRSPAALPASGALGGANVLLVTIDTLRRDRLGAYGSDRGLTPTLDALARHGVRYTQAFSHVPMTLPAHASILTGLTPAHHGVHNNTSFRLDEQVPTLASVLKRAGYRTGAFVSAFVLDGRFGLDRGFDEYDDRLPHAARATFHFAERRAADVLALAANWILAPSPNRASPATQAQPWFAWVHLFDPHAPYEAPPEYRRGRPAYDEEIAYADAMLGQFLDRLRAAGALDRTLIVVTADHGESLGDHGETTHGLFAYDATIAVPLIVACPGVRVGSLAAPVMHADVLPTIVDLVGGEVPPRLDGRSLVEPPPADRPVYIEALDAWLTRGWAPLYAVVRSGAKYIDLPDAELYDLASDPGELHNRADRDPRADALRRIAVDLRPPSIARSVAGLDTDTAARLRSLGYVGSAAPARRAFTSADDPKRLVGLNERFNSALTTFDTGHPDEAAAALDAILRERPDFVAARTSEATALLAMHRSADAVRLLRAAPADEAALPDLSAKLGAALRDAGDLTGAADAFERAREAGDQNPDLLSDLGVVYAAQGRTADARALFERAVAMNPRSATAWFNLGLLELQNRRSDRAADALRRAVAAEPEYGEAWRHAERLQPHNYDLLFNLGMLLSESAHPADAVPYLERFAREAPRPRYEADVSRVRGTLARIR